MPELLITSILWALSFGLIARYLSGLDATLVASVRLLLTALLFVPWLRPLPIGRAGRLMAVGAVQFGAMYLAYIASYGHLRGYEVAVFTVLTPFHVVLLDALFTRSLRVRQIVAVTLSVVGALVITWRPPDTGALLRGFALVQIANLCFAAGQVLYRRVQPDSGLPHARAFAWCALGAAVVTGAIAIVTVAWPQVQIDRRQLLVLVYLGLLPSGLGFYLWNRGATRVSATTLAAMNNLKVPLGVLCALFVFGEQAAGGRLVVGAALIALALLLARREDRCRPAME